MFIKSLVAAAAISSVVAFGSVGAAHADPHVSVGFGFDVGAPEYVGWDGNNDGYDGGYNGGYDGGYDGDAYWRHRHHRRQWDNPPPVMSYGISCADGRSVVAGSGFRGISAYSCSAPVYRYTAWKHGEQFRIAVNMRGRIVGVSPIY